VFVPLVSAEQAVPFILKLQFTAAVRYEHYSDFGGIATPKLGLIYDPIEDVEFKSTWGRSYKAPTLFQEYQPSSAYLFPAATLGATGYPPTRPHCF